MSANTGSEAPAASGTPVKKRSCASRLFAAICWLSLAISVGAWVMVRFGDAWPPATFLMFGPRWILLLPPAFLLLVALVLRRRSLPVVVLALLVVAGPMMGFRVPFPGKTSDAAPLRVLTCNLHNARIESDAIERLVREEKPDVAAFQQSNSPRQFAKFAAPEWHTHYASGLFLASRFPIRHVEVLGTNSTDERGMAARYELETPQGRLTLFSLHFASPRDALAQFASGQKAGWDDVEKNSTIRRQQSARLETAAQGIPGSVILLGDFNTPTESVVFHKAWASFEDAFSAAGWGWGYTFRIQRTAVRIDHILVGGGGHTVRSWVGPDIGSPHLPLLADVSWPANNPLPQ